jgi:hypothetical protein
MKNLMIFIICFLSIIVYGQEENTESDGLRLDALYEMPIPEGWTTERFPIPIGFAPQISYKGVEDICFSPGWGNVKSEEYWTYAFLWYLDDSPETNAEIIATNLKAYYSGLIRANTDSSKISADNPIPVFTTFIKVDPVSDDMETFTGTIVMTDYMQMKPIALNCIVHLKFCPETSKTILFYELSPQFFTHKIWEQLDQLWSDFRCSKK